MAAATIAMSVVLLVSTVVYIDLLCVVGFCYPHIFMHNLVNIRLGYRSLKKVAVLTYYVYFHVIQAIYNV